MIINNTLNGFYDKSEMEFLGQEIDFKFMTSKQLDIEIATSIALYNKLYPPKQKSGFAKFMRQAIPIAVVAGGVAISGGAVLAAYGVSVPAATATATASLSSVSLSAAASAVATGATYATSAGLIYGGITGKTPPEKLMSAADLIGSGSARIAIEKLAKREMVKQGVKIQDKDKRSNDALKARVIKEQQILANKLREQATLEAEISGMPLQQKPKVGALELAAVATPFLLYFLG